MAQNGRSFLRTSLWSETELHLRNTYTACMTRNEANWCELMRTLWFISTWGNCNEFETAESIMQGSVCRYCREDWLISLGCPALYPLSAIASRHPKLASWVPSNFGTNLKTCFCADPSKYLNALSALCIGATLALLPPSLYSRLTTTWLQGLCCLLLVFVMFGFSIWLCEVCEVLWAECSNETMAAAALPKPLPGFWACN